MSRIIRVDNRLASVLDVPTHSKITFYQAVALLDAYITKRKLDDPESNMYDDMDPDRHLDTTVIISAVGGFHLYCARCYHHLPTFEGTCSRCGLTLKKNDYKKAEKFAKLLSREAMRKENEKRDERPSQIIGPH